ncbi:unnamed protein product [Chondrus crispus]|uniref:Uncharacterized protein n=1 Tax=Chondrus crispus TaxID=2769 RepID=R7QFQ7_CHOCR|nr:unnamed protein product [Chondrus crispus]CDF36286.1 unnamed protein product [Chondrus crispus]|eukprot:XP_005716105.1 unnamed protein product [Chondrus crispus]
MWIYASNKNINCFRHLAALCTPSKRPSRHTNIFPDTASTPESETSETGQPESLLPRSFLKDPTFLSQPLPHSLPYLAHFWNNPLSPTSSISPNTCTLRHSAVSPPLPTSTPSPATSPVLDWQKSAPWHLPPPLPPPTPATHIP